jgi:beta-galactosidase
LTRAAEAAEPGRVWLSMDHDWKFHLGDPRDAQSPAFDDGKWQTLDVPHDWSIEGPFDQKNDTGRGGGYLPAGVGWYRKQFTLPADFAGRRVFIDFDGVMANSDVWINGAHLGKRPFGYISFRYELTDHLSPAAKPNLLAVRADNSAQPASRWYSGAGIYRHVRLVVVDPVHIDHWGTFVSAPKVAADLAVVHVQSTVVNQSEAARKVTLRTAILDPDGKTVETDEATETVPPGKSVDFRQDFKVKDPRLWDLDHPNLYRASTKLLAGGAAFDNDEVTFGIREARFDAKTGFWLNGKNLKIKGVCLHHDAGGLGAAVPLRAWERRFEILKQLGCNAIRTAHNPPAPEFLDLADRMGLLVMDELFDCWTVAKNRADYHLFFKEWSLIDTRDTVRRDRNHPSVILYSAGNEIHDTPKADLAKQILTSLCDEFHKNDATRPVTQALFRPNVSHDFDNGLADLLDVIGTNYRDKELLAAQKAKPERKIIGTEFGMGRPAWLLVRDNPSYSGHFLWTGIDYLGEAVWPNVVNGSGLVDRTGFVRPAGYERQSWWADQPVVHIARLGGPGARGRTERFSDWTPRDARKEETTVEVYSNCEQVELVLNGKSLGTKPRDPDDAPRTWKVPFEAGTIKALGKNKDKVVATHELRTAAKPAKVILATDRAKLGTDWDDVAYVTATVADSDGITVPWADDLISFKVTGAGVLAAVDNGDLACHESFRATERHAFQGRCVAILKARRPGEKITLTATAPGLTAATIAIETVDPAGHPLRRSD